MFYKDYIEIVYKLGRGYFTIKDLIDYFIIAKGKGRSTVYKDIKEMELLNIIEINSCSNNSYIRLLRHAMCYVKKNSCQTDAKILKDIFKSQVLLRLYIRDFKRSLFLLKLDNRYEKLLNGLLKRFQKMNPNIKKDELEARIEKEIKRNSNKLSHEDKIKSLNELEILHTYLSTAYFNQTTNKLTLEFSIIDTNNNLSKTSIFLRIYSTINLFCSIFLNIFEFDDLQKYFEFSYLIIVKKDNRKKHINKNIKDMSKSTISKVTKNEKESLNKSLLLVDYDLLEKYYADNSLIKHIECVSLKDLDKELEKIKNNISK